MDNRKTELKRQVEASQVEADCLKLEPGNGMSFRIRDLETFNRIRARLSRLKIKAGREFAVSVEGNTVTVTCVS